MTEDRVEGRSLGTVYLVGAGPGDPGLLTLRGREVLGQAEVVIHDRLASPRLLAFAPSEAERIYVGKRVGRHTVDQEGINQLLLVKAREGKKVVRLKGGDPFIFGRGGEEAQVLTREGIPYEIVPGVTSAIAVPAYAGIPLTHRAHTSSVAFVTGHREETKEGTEIDWAGLATGVGTLVFLMGMKNLPSIVDQLLRHGRRKETPVAVIRWGTTPLHRSITGTLTTIVEQVKSAGLRPPAVIVVGDVVGLRHELNWFEGRSLLGKRILVTRTREQASDLVKGLEERWAQCIECPTIAVGPPESWTSLDKALTDLSTFDWVVFSSTNAVRFFFERLWEKGMDPRALGKVRLAAVGTGTAKALEDMHLRVDLIPEDFRAEGLLEAFRQEGVAGRRILIPRGQQAREVLPEGLEAMGAEVMIAPTYRTYAPDLLPEVLQSLNEAPLNVITFTSSSTVRNFFPAFPETLRKRLLGEAVVACIGPVTAATAEKFGLHVSIQPAEFTIPALIDAIEEHFRNRQS